MKRSIFILVGVLVVATAFFCASFFATHYFCSSRAAQKMDDLTWLREEFHLSPTEMKRIEQLHAGYLPKCAEMCLKIAAKKAEVDTALDGSTNVNAMVEKKLIELGEMRAQCQAQMLQHFVEVSQAMPAGTGQRYLAEMRRISLGAHEQVEESMSGTTGHAHGAH